VDNLERGAVPQWVGRKGLVDNAPSAGDEEVCGVLWHSGAVGVGYTDSRSRIFTGVELAIFLSLELTIPQQLSSNSLRTSPLGLGNEFFIGGGPAADPQGFVS
jgi:hypothetical protein